MGNARSQRCQPRRPLYLFYLIHRTWNVVVEHTGVGKEEPCEEIDRDTELSSKCSGCRDCGYQQEDGLSFASESDMAPNAEEELLVVKPWGPQPEKQERLRPPTYNAEDYAVALRRWGRRPIASPPETHNGTLPSTTSSSSGYASGSGEMTLRQFTSVSELLNKLRADLRLAFPSFVQEFASAPADGITLLLETLRGVQLAQNSPPSGQTGPRIGTRRAALDELGCVECLAACGERCADAPRLLVEAQPGLLALAVCLTSSLNRSRVLALQLLTRVCQTPDGHVAVSEAVSTLRLRYGEGGRFRFLAGALLAPRAAIVLRVAGVSFLNAFIKSAPRAQTKLYIQAEACEAGLEPNVLQEWLTDLESGGDESMTELLRKEVQRWSRNCVDIEALQKRAIRAEEACRMLSKKISALQSQIQNLQVEHLNGYNSSRACNDKSNMTKLRAETSQKISSNGEDEGISSSERSSSPEDRKSDENRLKMPSMDNDQETTIDDVIEELRIIVKDAEEEYEDKKPRNRDNIQTSNKDVTSGSKMSLSNAGDTFASDDFEDKNPAKSKVKVSQQNSKHSEASRESQICEQSPVTYFGNRESQDYCNSDSSATRKLSSNTSTISKSSTNGSLKILVKGPEIEEAIIPAILHPQPPRRSPPSLTAILAVRNCGFGDADGQETYNSPGDDVEDETVGDGSDSLLSASRLKYIRNESTSEVSTRERNLTNLSQGHATNVASNQSRTAEARAATMGKMNASYVDLCDFGPSKPRRDNNEISKKTIRNYEVSSGAEMEIGTKSDRCENSVGGVGVERKAYSQNGEQSQRHGSNKHRSEVEKRKMLRRTASHDVVDSKSTLKRNGSVNKIEGRIRKFESLNSFENFNANHFSRTASSENISRQQFAVDIGKSRMRRSESFHHVSLAKRGEPSSRGGSDSELFYVTDFDLEPLVTHGVKSEHSKSSSLLTKSLDRIDEGLDSMVDIVLTEESQWANKKRLQNGKQSKKNDNYTSVVEKEKRSKNGNKQRTTSDKQQRARQDTRGRNDAAPPIFDKPLKNDELYNGYGRTAATMPIRSDELYTDKPRQMPWNSDADGDNTLAVLSKPGSLRESFCLDKLGNKFSARSNDSAIYLPGRSYDAFRLSKSRFNAGKYSGHNLSQENLNGTRNSIILPTGNHGKVTDVLSGLY